MQKKETSEGIEDFNEGNNCGMCRHQIMTGQNNDMSGCWRRECGLTCQFENKDIRICPVCDNNVDRRDMYYTKDCHGITFRLVCEKCYDKLMSKGYDGEYYTDADEQIEEDY